jgi:hypothetical protein
MRGEGAPSSIPFLALVGYHEEQMLPENNVLVEERLESGANQTGL